MIDRQSTGGLRLEYNTYEFQKCFVGHSHEAEWRDDILSACDEALPEFGLEPWYAADQFEPTKPLRDKVVELVANARYGIYDLSYWRDERGVWQMPRNVFIELGIAIALNRPTLLLRHASNRLRLLKGEKVDPELAGLQDEIVGEPLGIDGHPKKGWLEGKRRMPCCGHAVGLPSSPRRDCRHDRWIVLIEGTHRVTVQSIHPQYSSTRYSLYGETHSPSQAKSLSAGSASLECGARPCKALCLDVTRTCVLRRVDYERTIWFDCWQYNVCVSPLKRAIHTPASALPFFFECLGCHQMTH